MRDDIPDFPNVFDNTDRRSTSGTPSISTNRSTKRFACCSSTRPCGDECRAPPAISSSTSSRISPRRFCCCLRLVAAPAYQVFGVGDDDQVIYGYTGATPEFLIDFDRLFPGAGTLRARDQLSLSRAVVTAAANLLSTTDVGSPRTSRPTPSSRGPSLVERLAEGAMALRAGELITAWFADGVALNDIAVLSRVNHALLPTQAVLESLGVAHSSPVGPEFPRRTAVRAFRAYLRIGLAPDLISRGPTSKRSSVDPPVGSPGP